MIINCKGKQVKLPDFLIVGAAKCGTTSLFHYLRQHPQVFMPVVKEPRFFRFGEQHPRNLFPNLKSYDKAIIWKFDDYVDLFRVAEKEQIIGEASPQYLYAYDTAIKNIISIYGDSHKELKIIAILRNPIERAFSHFYFQVRRGIEPLSFEKAIEKQTIQERAPENMGYDYIEHGMYYKMVKAYSEKFANVKLCFFEELRNTRKLLSDISNFLEISPDVVIDHNVKIGASGIPKNKLLVSLIDKSNRFCKTVLPYNLKLVQLRDKILSKTLDKPKMDNLTKEKMINIYKNDILELQKLTNKDLSHWLK